MWLHVLAKYWISKPISYLSFYSEPDNLSLLGIVSWGDVRTKQTDGLLPDEASRERGDRQIWTSRNTLQPDTVQTQGTHALIWYDTPAGRTCKAAHIPAFGSAGKCASVISSRSLCSTVVMPPNSTTAFDVWKGTHVGKQKDEVFLDYSRLICTHCKCMTYKCADVIDYKLLLFLITYNWCISMFKAKISL